MKPTQPAAMTVTLPHARSRAWLLAAGAALFSLSAQASELEALLRDSLSHPAASAAAERVLAASEQLAVARSQYFGAGGLAAVASRYEDARFIGTLSPSALANPPFARDQRRYGAYYSLPIDLSGALAASRRASASELEAARLAERQVQLLKLHDTTGAYVRLQALRRQGEVLAVQQQRVGETVQRVRQQVLSEQSSNAELRLAEAELARLQSDQERLAGALASAEAALAEASGRSLRPQNADIAIPAWSAGEVQTSLPAALSSAEAVAASERARAAKRALWPQLQADADYFQFDGGGHSPDSWSLGAKLSLPLDPAAHRRASAAEAQARAASQNQQAAVRGAARDLQALAAAYRSARADVQALDQEVAAREEVVRVQSALQKVGMASLEDYLRQQRDLLDAEARRSQAQEQAVSAWSMAQLLLGAPVEDYIQALNVGAATSAP